MIVAPLFWCFAVSMGPPQRVFKCLLIAALLVLHPVCAKSSKRKRERRKAKRLDRQLREKKFSCESSVRVSNHGGASTVDCGGPNFDIENCVLRCVSEHCYKEVYAQEPLEEGEVDYYRENSFKLCGREELKQQELQGKG